MLHRCISKSFVLDCFDPSLPNTGLLTTIVPLKRLHDPYISERKLEQGDDLLVKRRIGLQPKIQVSESH